MAASPGKFGGASAWLLVSGYNLTTAKNQSMSFKQTAVTEPTHGLGDAWEEHTPVGVSKGELAVDGGFFDTNTNAAHAALSAGFPTTPQSAARSVCLGFAGHTIGEPFTGFYGTYQQSYAVQGQLGALTKANAEYTIAGQVDHGIIINALATKTADWNTKTDAAQVDNGASSANGAVGYLQVTACSGFTNFVGKLRDSTDDNTYADLIAFADNVVAPFAERAIVAGTIDRYMSFDGNVTGSGSITAFCGISRG